MLTILTLLKKYRIFVIGIVAIFVIALAVSMYSCLKPVTSLNQRETQDIQEGIRTKNDQKIIDGLAASDARVAVGVEEVARTDEEARKVEEAKRDAVKNYEGWSSEDLAAEAERRLQAERESNK